jgi:hypothetical protein
MKLATALCASSLLCAAPAAGATSVPGAVSAATVLDRYIAVTGGSAVWKAQQTERSRIEGRSPDGTEVLLRATVSMSRKGNFLSDVQLPEAGREGVFNGIAWSWTPLSGARIRKGADRDEALRGSRMLEEADWHSRYPKSRVDAVEEIDGRSCYKVRLLPSPEQKTEWFDVATGLLVRRSAIEAGATPVSYTVETWHTQDGLKQPQIMLATRGDLTYRLTVLTVSYNNLRLPDDVRYPATVESYLNEQRAGIALPNAEDLIERHIFESGGASAYERLRTQRITGTIEYLSRNLEARTETVSAGDGRYYQSVDIPGLGKQEEGSDGRVAWQRSPILGPQAKPRHSLKGLGVTLDAADVVGWRYLVGEVRTESMEKVNGRDCYRVRVRGRGGRQESTRWYDRRTGLLYRTSLLSKTAMGDVPTILTYQAWRDVEGLKWPVRIHMLVSGQEMVFRADEVSLNSALDEAVFDLPDDVRRLRTEETEGQ